MSATYSASDVDKATICCFLLMQETAPPDNRNRFPVVEWRLSGSPAQSESEYPESFPFDDFWYHRPRSAVALR